MKKILILLTVSIFIFSCAEEEKKDKKEGVSSSSTETNKYVSEICDCFKEEVDFEAMTTIRRAQRELEKMDEDIDAQSKITNCVGKVVKKLGDDMAGLKDDTERKAMLKNVLKSIIDCDCMDPLYDLIPYEDLPDLIDGAEREMERDLERRKEWSNEEYDPYGDEYPDPYYDDMPIEEGYDAEYPY